MGGSRIRRMDDMAYAICFPENKVTRSDTWFQSSGIGNVSMLADSSKNDYLQHYGIKGQKWGVITKEYEPVAVDHRKTRSGGPLARIRNRVRERMARDDAEVAADRKLRQERLKKINERTKKAGTALGVSLLAGAFIYGYRHNVLKGLMNRFSLSGSLKSLLNMVPSAAEREGLMTSALFAGDAKMRSQQSYLDRITGNFKAAGQMLTGQHYRAKIQKAKDLIQQLGGTAVTKSDEIIKGRRRG